MKKIPVVEVFGPTIQGEGALCGKVSYFIRTGGCQYRCSWCFGVLPGRRIPKVVLAGEPNKKIFEVVPGDILLTFDQQTQQLVETTVVDVGSREVDEWLRIRIEGRVYFVTPEHPFFTTRGEICASDLEIGDMILHANPVDKLSWSKRGDRNFVPRNGYEVQWSSEYYPSTRPSPLKVYNLTCSPHNSYLVDYMWVHNCDSMHAVTPSEIKKNAIYMTADDIVAWFAKNSPPVRKLSWITLTGGDPVIWDLRDVVSSLRLAGFKVGVETQGVIWRDWLTYCDLVTCSPKPPSSGMDHKIRFDVLHKYALNLRGRFNLKVVVFDEKDLDFAEMVHETWSSVPFFLSSGTPLYDGKGTIQKRILRQYHWLAEQVFARPMLHDATVLPQVHALLWGRDLGR